MLSVAFIDSLGITAKFIKVEDDAPHTIFEANSDTKTVTIGGFEVDHNSLSAIGKKPGDPESIMLFSGINDDNVEVGSSGKKNDWSILAGNKFGIDSSGNI
jgi:hypothetical protein